MNTHEGKWKFLHKVVVEAEEGFFKMSEVAKEGVHVSDTVTPHLPV